MAVHGDYIGSIHRTPPDEQGGTHRLPTFQEAVDAGFCKAIDSVQVVDRWRCISCQQEPNPDHRYGCRAAFVYAQQQENASCRADLRTPRVPHGDAPVSKGGAA